jgi:DNA polymerase I
MSEILVFDIEADDLLIPCTRMHVLCTEGLSSGEKKYWKEGDFGWKDELSNAKGIAGHNIMGYDLPALKKLYDWEPPEEVSLIDTMLLSQILNFRRFGQGGHSLDAWGAQLGVPKLDFSDYSEFTEEMLVYCQRDVELNVLVLRKLLGELKLYNGKAPLLNTYIRAEHYIAEWAATAELHGWPFNFDRAVELFEEMSGKLEIAEDKIESKLGMKAVIKDKESGLQEGIVKEPKWTKAGCYNHHTANWFDIDPWSGYVGEERPIAGAYCRVEFKPLKLSSTDDVKSFLFKHGWKPTEWNFKKDDNGFVKDENGKRVKSSPKITDDSLEILGGDGALYKEYKSISSRYSILKNWLDATEVTSEGTVLHGSCFTIGTPSMRARHKIIANIPSVDSVYGSEIRELFIAKEGWVIVGADSSGNQARGLAHYLGDEEFTDVIVNKDIHIYNARKIIEVLDDMRIRHTFTPESLRPKAKRVLYAFLFGASGGKLWSYLFDAQDDGKGGAFKKGFANAVPGFANLIKKLDTQWDRTKDFRNKQQGYIPSLVGNRIYADSKHKLLVYLLQGAEKITCAASGMLLMQELKKRKIPYQPLVMYHDEFQFMTPREFAEEALEIGKWAFKEGPKRVGIDIMDGDGSIGANWKETH